MKKICNGKKGSSSDEHNIKSLLRKNRIWLYYVIYDRRDFELFQWPNSSSFSRCLPLPREFWRHHAGQTLRMARARRRHLALPAFFGILKKRTTTNQAIIIDRYMDFSLLKANQVHGSFWDDDPVPGMAEGLKIWGLTELPRSGKGERGPAPPPVPPSLRAVIVGWLAWLAWLYSCCSPSSSSEKISPHWLAYFCPMAPCCRSLARVLHTRSPYVASAMMNVGCGWALDSLSLII